MLVCYCFPGHIIDLTVDPTSTLTLTNTITEVCWIVAAEDDLIFENSESFTLTVVPMTAGVSVGLQSTVTVTVLDNDSKTSLYFLVRVTVSSIMIILVHADVTVAMAYDQYSVNEGGTVMVCVTLTGQLGISVVVDLISTMGTGKS